MRDGNAGGLKGSVPLKKPELNVTSKLACGIRTIWFDEDFLVSRRKLP